MAAPSINTRITLTGADEVRRHLEEIAKAGERSGNQTRAALQAATGSLNTFTSSARSGAASSGQMRFALQNLSFQVNDVATSLASGGDVMRVFAQQGGQVFQVFQQGGGFSAVMTAAGASISNLITPMRLAAAGALAFAAAFAFVIEKAASAEGAARKFDVILQGMRKNTGVTGKQLEQVAQNLADVGISASEARPLIAKFLQTGGDPRQTAQVLRTAADVQAVLGTSIEEFVNAVAEGGPALEKFAQRLGIVQGLSKEVQEQLDAARKSAEAFQRQIAAAFADRQKQLADLGRTEKRAQEDRDRQREQQRGGRTPEQQQEEDRAVAHARALEDINRESADRINEIIAARNRENAAQLEVFNKQVLSEAQAALDTGQGLLQQISAQVGGKFAQSLGPLGRALNDLSKAWQGFINSLAQSSIITGIVAGLQSMTTAITTLLKGEFSIGALGIAIAAAVPIFAALRIAAVGLTAALGPLGLGVAILGLAVAFIDLNKAWAGAVAAADGFWTLLKAFGGWLAETFAHLVDDFVIQPIINVIDWFNRLIAKAREVATALASVFGGGGGNLPVAEAPIPGRAAGGLVRGPGTGTSDSVLSRLSNGEFVINALATRMNLPLLQAINSMRMPTMPRFSMPRGFAMGGLATAGAGGTRTPVILNIGGETFNLEGDAATAQRVIRFGRKRAMLSAGRLPSTA